MSNPTALLSRRQKRRDVREISEEPVVGKDILELLSSAMYLDPRSVYREYIQNAADAIDAAFAGGILSEENPGRIDMSLDQDKRSVLIRDNGIGLPASDAERVLTAFGASTKRGTPARGFRGVGRLAAFGYAQVVSFKTKASGEMMSTEVRWDCRKLKAALLNPSYHGDLKQTVRDVVTITVEEEQEVSLHYFEVRLERVIRIKNDVLLNVEDISRYLGEVGPAPFHKNFPFAAAVTEHLRSHILPCRFRVFVNGSTTAITRPHRDEFWLSKVKSDRISDVELVHIPGEDGNVLAVGWLAHHGYLGAIHAADELRGLRARVGDVQIGTGELFAEAFPEPRFNSWTIGEIHVVDRRIVPNGRRDGFEQSGAYSDLLAQLVLIGRRQATRCRQSSACRNRIRGFELREQKIRELFAVLGQPNISRSRELRIRREIGGSFDEMKRLIGSTILAERDQNRLTRRIASLEARYRDLSSRTEVIDAFAELGPSQRGAYEQMIDLIYDCSSNRNAARVLVDRIMARLVAQSVRARRRRKRR